MNKLEKDILNNVIYKYYKKHNKLPNCGHCLVAYNISINGDMLDYMLDIKDDYIKVIYTYYKKSLDENKYISSSFNLYHK